MNHFKNFRCNLYETWDLQIDIGYLKFGVQERGLVFVIKFESYQCIWGI